MMGEMNASEEEQKEVVDTLLNELIRDELTFVGQYVSYSDLCASWGYKSLHTRIEKQIREEMEHAQALIGRMVKLGRNLSVQRMHPMKRNESVQELVKNLQDGESASVRIYNLAIFLITDVGDMVTAELLVRLLKEEKKYAEWLKIDPSQTDDMRN